ncbi:MAG: DpnII family type II restriction endonuclease [Candidatus Saccharicenans sp.]|uniref:DpnII family type II restriction endonuclease n=1 Tax=Candidatus Saccharicenans sp. TaxID=2819258 RepID=UPI0040493D79
MQINIYQEFFKLLDKESIINLFSETLIETNHDFKFFVDWKKVKANVEKYKLELNILNSLIRHKEFKKALKNILIRYPEVLPCFPLLIAVRERQFKLVEDFTSSEAKIIITILIQES